MDFEEITTRKIPTIPPNKVNSKNNLKTGTGLTNRFVVSIVSLWFVDVAVQLTIVLMLLNHDGVARSGSMSDSNDSPRGRLGIEPSNMAASLVVAFSSNGLGTPAHVKKINPALTDNATTPTEAVISGNL